MSVGRRNQDAPQDPSIRRLLSCDRCHRQFDVSWRAPGSQFRCSCGEAITVRRSAVHEAAVVRCSACGAPRGEAVDACGFCGSGFTLHERDLHTVCPRCAARISDRARYCHACGTLIAPTGVAGVETERPCPACGEVSRLVSRSLGGRAMTVLECGRCAGMWLGNEVFEHLERASRREAASGEGRPPSPARRPTPPVADERTTRYRPCPVCSTLMHRRNYGRRSGVILDTCRQHGLWFDQGELDAILEWIRHGGLDRAERHSARMDAEDERMRRLYGGEEREWDWTADPLVRRRTLGDFVDGILAFLGR